MAVEDAITYGLLAELQTFAAAQTPAITVSLPNIDFTPPTPSKTARWLRATVHRFDTMGLGISSNSSNQHYGLFQVDVFYGLGAGELAPLRVAAALAAYFKRGTVIVKDGFATHIWKPPTVHDLAPLNPWVMVPVRVPYLTLAPNPA